MAFCVSAGTKNVKNVKKYVKVCGCLHKAYMYTVCVCACARVCVCMQVSSHVYRCECEHWWGKWCYSLCVLVPSDIRSLRAGHSTIGSHSQVRIVIAMMTGRTKNRMCWQCSLEWKEEKGDEQKRGAVGETWSECGFRLVVLDFRNEMLFYLPSPSPGLSAIKGCEDFQQLLYSPWSPKWAERLTDGLTFSWLYIFFFFKSFMWCTSCYFISVIHFSENRVLLYWLLSY